MKRLLLILAICFVMQSSTLANDNILTTAAANGSFKTLTSLVVAADLDEALQADGNFTVFAPTDEAFAKLPEETLKSLLRPENREQLASILKYHVLPTEVTVPKRNSHPTKSAKTLLGKRVNFDRKGTKVKVNGANIVIRNIKCSNGIIQVIDAVLIPPKEDKTIVGVANQAGQFKTLLSAAKAAGLVDTLQSKGPLTVFAPTDQAFAALPKGTIQQLLKPENKEQLATILKYHVVAGKVSAVDAIKAETAQTVADQSVTFTIESGKLKVNDSTVISNDLKASNGLIHIVDKVLLPATRDNGKPSQHSSQSAPAKEVTISSNWSNPVERDGVMAETIRIRVSGGGRVNLTNVKADEIITSIAGGGTVSLQGDVAKHEAKVNGGAVLNARDLLASTTKITVNGGGSAEVNSTEILDIYAAGSAKVRYVATDAKINKSVGRYSDVKEIH